MLNDFKAFIARGNILDLAIAVIMGAAFGAIVKTFTDGIIMPVIGFITGGIDFKDKVITLDAKHTSGDVLLGIAAILVGLSIGYFVFRFRALNKEIYQKSPVADESTSES